LRLRLINDLAIEHRGVGPHGDLAGLEQGHDVFPRHRRNAFGAIVAEQFAVKARCIDSRLRVKDRCAFVEVLATVVVDVTRELGDSCRTLAARGETGNALRIELLGGGLEFLEVGRHFQPCLLQQVLAVVEHLPFGDQRNDVGLATKRGGVHDVFRIVAEIVATQGLVPAVFREHLALLQWACHEDVDCGRLGGKLGGKLLCQLAFL